MREDFYLAPSGSEAIACLNHLGIVVDHSGCFVEGRHKVCLFFERGLPVGTVDGHRHDWSDIVQRLKPRRRGER